MARQPVPNLPLICEETQTIVTATFAVSYVQLIN